MPDFTSNTGDSSTIDPEIAEANVRLLQKRQALQESRGLTQDQPNCTETTETTEETERRNDSEIPRILNDLEGPRGIEKESAVADSSPTVKRDEPPNGQVLNPNQPLKEFVAKAAIISMDAASDGTGDDWKSPTWEFVRLCRTHPKLMSLTADEAARKIPWNATGFEDEEQLQFLVEWGRVRSLPGVSPLEWAASLARQHPLVSTRKESKTFDRFVSLAGWLQVIVGIDNHIFLPTRKVAEILNLKSHTTVATLCKIAVADKLMDLVERATQHRATRYRFRVERYEILIKHQS